jgi:YidC/Oxa1 family membrane protein insertase
MPAPAQKRSSNFVQFLLIFAIVYLGSQLLLKQFFPQPGTNPQGAVHISVPNVTAGNNPVMTVTNQTGSGIFLKNTCPQPPMAVLYRAGGASGSALPVTSSQTTVPCEVPSVVPPNGSVQVSLSPWKYSVFGKDGMYEVKLPVYASTGAIAANQSPSQTLSATFTLSEPGVFTKLFRTFISKPFLNFLILVASVLPDHNLAIAIIALTLLVKLLLWFPTQHALEGQKKMQLLQPKLNELKKKYPNDPQKQQEETVKLWKEHKVNPFQSCWPTLVQFPILIGLFYVIRDESNLALSRHLIYPVYQHLTWGFGTRFLGLDLLRPEFVVLPILLVVLQFLQMKLSFKIADNKRKQQSNIVDVGKEAPAMASMELQQKIMLYALPLMIGFFAIKFPVAVSIYWGVSTLFGIGQQMIVNREHIRP